eukprot:gnl/MRDRNA2_/MRDRNA2_122289_c0_seq1.p1 gnl/MRDRNA2_/MRDRNA2_122289_c0~~gnl/MRDRNA2_/MRDRNA2_122289_c0_seq1.p1  ORF type:complete len:299 (+),score=61.13 gnl/MRDRNA2_/MRDRNA2_122289_c0_seq1:51-899(+)
MPASTSSPPTLSTPMPTPPKQEKKEDKTGMIIGLLIAVGVILGAAVVGIMFFIYKKRQQGKSGDAGSNQQGKSGNAGFNVVAGPGPFDQAPQPQTVGSALKPQDDSSATIFNSSMRPPPTTSTSVGSLMAPLPPPQQAHPTHEVCWMHLDDKWCEVGFFEKKFADVLERDYANANGNLQNFSCQLDDLMPGFSALVIKFRESDDQYSFQQISDGGGSRNVRRFELQNGNRQVEFLVFKRNGWKIAFGDKIPHTAEALTAAVPEECVTHCVMNSQTKGSSIYI